MVRFVLIGFGVFLLLAIGAAILLFRAGERLLDENDVLVEDLEEEKGEDK